MRTNQICMNFQNFLIVNTEFQKGKIGRSHVISPALYISVRLWWKIACYFIYLCKNSILAIWDESHIILETNFEKKCLWYFLNLFRSTPLSKNSSQKWKMVPMKRSYFCEWNLFQMWIQINLGVQIRYAHRIFHKPSQNFSMNHARLDIIILVCSLWEKPNDRNRILVRFKKIKSRYEYVLCIAFKVESILETHGYCCRPLSSNCTKTG